MTFLNYVGLAIYTSFGIIVKDRNFINRIYLSHCIRANPRSTLITAVAAAAVVVAAAAAREPPRLP